MAQLGNTIVNGVLRVNGGIFASAFTGNLTGNVTGNASSATKLQTARTINGVSFDGSANITIADNTKLPLAGGTITGNISYNMNSSTQIPFKIYGGDVNGQGISIGAGAATIIGSGESAKACESLLTATTEELWVTSDNDIKFYTNCQTIGNKVGVFLNASRAFYPDKNNTGTLGTSSNKWNNVYATTFTGNLSGNATTATSATKATQDSDGKAINTTYFKKAGGTISGAVIIDDTTSNYPFTVCGSGAEESVFSVDKSGNCYSHTRGTLCGSYDGSAINIQAMSSADFESKKASMVDGSIVAVW